MQRYITFCTWYNTVKTILTIPQELNSRVIESDNTNGSPGNGWIL